jgi:hypothetical protein
MAVGEEGTYLTSLTFDSYSVNTGGGYKASFVFEGFDGDMTGCFTASSTWPVNASSTTGPKCKVLDENSAVVAGLTGKTITSDTVAPSQYQGTLDIYPLSAGSYTIEYYDDTSPLVGSESFVVANTNPKMKDLASGVLVNSVSASATSLVVNVGSGTDAEIKGVWPDTPFYITAMPANPSAGVPNSLDSEIMKVSAVGTDGSGNTTLSVARAQRGSTAQAFSAGAVITNASYADDAVVWGEETSPENPSPWIETGDIKDGQITTAKVADGAITGAKIDFTSFIAGAASFTAISAGADQNATVNIPAQANTNYLVFLTIADHTPYWTEIVYRPSEKTTTNFKITAMNKGNGSTGAFNINYLVIPQ